MQDEKLKSAFVKSIKHYFEGNDFEETSKLKEDGRKYKKEYFDTLESDLLSPEDQPKKKTKKKAKK